jgi:hypothetical protein
MDEQMWAVPAPNWIMHRRDNIVLRGYITNNDPISMFEKSEMPSNICQILNADKKVFVQVEYIFNDVMPSVSKILLDLTWSDSQILAKVIDLCHDTYDLSEIIITPIYQDVEGYPKKYSDSNELMKALYAIRRDIHLQTMNTMVAAYNI